MGEEEIVVARALSSVAEKTTPPTTVVTQSRMKLRVCSIVVHLWVDLVLSVNYNYIFRYI